MYEHVYLWSDLLANCNGFYCHMVDTVTHIIIIIIIIIIIVLLITYKLRVSVGVASHPSRTTLLLELTYYQSA